MLDLYLANKTLMLSFWNFIELYGLQFLLMFQSEKQGHKIQWVNGLTIVEKGGNMVSKRFCSLLCLSSWPLKNTSVNEMQM